MQDQDQRHRTKRVASMISVSAKHQLNISHVCVSDNAICEDQVNYRPPLVLS